MPAFSLFGCSHGLRRPALPAPGRLTSIRWHRPSSKARSAARSGQLYPKNKVSVPARAGGTARTFMPEPAPTRKSRKVARMAAVTEGAILRDGVDPLKKGLDALATPRPVASVFPIDRSG